MLLTEMKAGKSVEILINRDGYKYRLVSKIEEVGKDCIFISLIATKTKIFQFEKDDKVEIIYRAEERLFKWSRIKGRMEELDGEKVHCLFGNQEGENYNRRNAYRVYVGLEVELFQYMVKPGLTPDMIIEMKSEQKELSETDIYDITKSRCLVKDISEGGIGLFANERLPLSAELAVHIPTQFGLLKLKLTVIRTTEERYELYRYFYGCNITESEKQLIKYLFHLQREYLQKARSEGIKKGKGLE